MTENPFNWSKDEITFLLGSSSDVLWTLDLDFRFTRIKTLEKTVHGYKAEELIGRPIMTILPPESIAKVAQMHAERMEKEARGLETSTAWLEMEVLNSAGERVWTEVRSTPVRDETGKITGYMGVNREITARKMVEEALRESEANFRELYRKAVAQEELYKSLLSSIPHPVALYTPQGETVSINPSFTRVFGFTNEDVAGRRIPFVPEEEQARSMEAIREVLAGRPCEGFETRRFTKDGRVLDILLSSSLYLDHDGNPAGIVVILQDMTKRKENEAKLKASEHKFSDIFMRAPLLIAVTNPDDGYFFDANDKFLEVSGFTREDMIGRTSVEIGWLKKEDRENFLEKLKAEGRCSDLEMVATAKDGHKVHCLYNCELIDIDGKTRLLTMIQDITEKRTLQEELDKAQRLEALGVLAGGLAHDFNNILTGIMGSISLAQEMVAPDSEVAINLRQCEKASVRASQLVGQLMTFAKGGAPVKKNIELAPLLQEAVSFALKGTSTRGELRIEPGLPKIEADEGQLSQAVNNLLINAAQAMPSGGTVKLEARSVLLPENNPHFLTPGKYLTITVADKGIGIPKENLRKIFDPYFTTKEKGTGLGLSTVYSIIKRHQGFIGVDSAPGKGTIFTIHLPASGKSEEEAHRHTRAAPSRGHGRILLMDDDALVQETAVTMLNALGYEVDCASDGQAAIDMAMRALEAGTPYAAAILDLTVSGGMGGREAAQIIGRINPGLPLIVSSGYSADPVMANYKSHGFIAAIPKPYRYADISQTVAKATRKG